MSRGYIVIAQNNAEHDYLEMTYALALSLKATQKENAICVCVDEYTRSLITKKHENIFDHIVDIPWADAAGDSNWKIHNKWKYIHMSPFDETIILDSDMLFSKPVDHWWDYLQKRDVWCCTNVKTFRGEDVTSDYYRTKFTQLELPDVYSNFTYFKKTQPAYEFFRMVELIMTHWNMYYDKFLKGIGQNWMSADVAFALAVKLLDKEDDFCDYNIKDVPTFVHMKSYVQNVPHNKISSIWSNSIQSDIADDLTINIGNYTQDLPVHYVHKEWLTTDKIKLYEKVLDI